MNLLAQSRHFEFHVVDAMAGDGNHMVAKRLRNEVRPRKDLEARLRAEGEFLLELSDVGDVLRCYEVLSSPTELMLQLVAGGSLAERLLKKSPSTNESDRVFRAVGSAVAHAHAHGIIHRDIKPSNILFTASSELRLADFGIAVRRGARSTAEGWDDIDVGTLGYAPPELLRDPSTANTETVDIYELGALLHELLLGVTPHMMHGEETEAELKARIIAGAPRDLTPRESELSNAHRRLLDAALAPNPSERPQSVAEILALL